MPSPDPWTLDYSPLGFGAISDASGEIIAFLQAPVGMDADLAAANARLMAAAPQLLAALKHIVDHFNVETIAVARAAIAKAEETP